MGIRVGRADNNIKNVCARSRWPAAGFTLLELLTAVLIAALLLAITTPNFAEFRRNARMTAAANDLLAALQVARSEAARRQQPVSLCAAVDAGIEEPVCSGESLAKLPERGWIIFADPNADCARVADPAVEPVIRVREAFGESSFTARATSACISFASNGFLRFGPSVGVLFCDDRGMKLQGGLTVARGLTLSPSGSARVTRDPDELQRLSLSCT